MPTSSTSRQSRLGGVLNNKRHLVSSTTFWAPNNEHETSSSSNNNYHHRHHHQSDAEGASTKQTRAPQSKPTSTFQSRSKSKKGDRSAAKDQRELEKRQEFRQLPSTALLRNSQSAMTSSDPSVGAFSLHADQTTTQPAALSLAGQLVLTGASKQADSLGSKSIEQTSSYSGHSSSNRAATNRGHLGGAHANKAYLASNTGLNFTNKVAIQHRQQQQQPPSQSSSLVSISAIGTEQHNDSSTSRLHQIAGDAKSSSKSATNAKATSTFTVRQHVNLKYIKTIIILLLAVDLIITVFVHQFSTNDQLSILWFSSFKLRFSLLNLILSSIWFIILIGAILFDIHFILAISSLVHIVSFFLLLGFSVLHFSRRIDYNTVHLFSLLTLLFSIIVLHVYLIVLAALTLYLMRAVKNRNQSSFN